MAIFAVVLTFVSEAGLFKRETTRVLVDSVAKDEYVQARELEGGNSVETYHIFKGRFFGGNVRDNSLTRVPFIDIASALVKDLRKNRYYPASSKEKGDLLIVVHWGVTAIEDDWEDLLGITDYGSNETGNAFGDEGSDALGGLDSGNSFSSDYAFDGDFYDQRQYSDASNAKLIGFDRALRRKGLMPQDEYELRTMLRDERYFIILMAYDWQKLRTEKEFDLLWSTRFSLDSIGTNFEEAYHSLSRAASDYYGTHLDGELAKSKTWLGSGDVETGELEVVETVEEEELEARKGK